MHSYQNLETLSNLYRLKALGFNYIDPIVLNTPTINQTLPNNIDRLNDAIASCHLCDLAKSCTNRQSGFGSIDAKVIFVDTHPILDNKNPNSYYSSKTGVMLKNMIEGVLKLTVNDVFVTFLAKCKPLGFNTPSNDEYHSCLAYLLKQIELMEPKIVVSLGEIPYQFLTNDTNSDFSSIRGEVITFLNTNLIAMHHPIFLSHNPSQKRDAMRDLSIIKGVIG